eukprot:UN03551
MVLVARTDAEAATMIDSNIDPVDHPHIKGATNKGVEHLFEAIRNGTDKDWEARAGCMTFPDAVAAALKAKRQRCKPVAEGHVEDVAAADEEGCRRPGL